MALSTAGPGEKLTVEKVEKLTQETAGLDNDEVPKGG